jgi:hypothetical protein
MPEYVTLKEIADRLGYANPASLRQAIVRGKLRGELRDDGPFRYYVTTEEWVEEYLRNRPPWKQDDRTLAMSSVNGDCA